MNQEIIATTDAPAAIGPYSQAVRVGDFIFTAGQIALDPTTGVLVEGDVAVQTERVLQNLQNVLTAAGSSLAQVVKTTVFLRLIGDFAAMNGVYETYFGASKPARSTVAVSALPRKARVEIEAVAYAPRLMAEVATARGNAEPAEKKKDKKKKKNK